MSVPKKQKPCLIKDTLYYGVCTEARAPLLYSLAQSNDTEMTVALVADPPRAQELVVELEMYSAWAEAKMPLQVLYFPEDPPPDIDAQRRADRNCDRLTVLSALLASPAGKRLLITTPEALLGNSPDKVSFAQQRITLRVGQSHFNSE